MSSNITTISGKTGPFEHNKPGDFGRNAAKNFQALALKEPEKALEATIEYTKTEGEHPQGKLAEDAFGYAQEDIKAIAPDGKDSLHLTQQSIAKALGGEDPKHAKFANEIADQYIKALDTNHDGKIDVPEQAAFILFQDDSINQIKGTLDAFADPKNGSSKELQDAMAKAKQEITDQFGKITSKADGKITASERGFSEYAVTTLPMVTQETVRQFMETFKLRERYAAFQKAQ
ncbi:MAG: hypothetical protein K2X66_00515 [Cyanobacteria bacterium]|nr:hypothetical protein [Cyanobacteriota bacterium]